MKPHIKSLDNSTISQHQVRATRATNVGRSTDCPGERTLTMLLSKSLGIPDFSIRVCGTE